MWIKFIPHVVIQHDICQCRVAKMQKNNNYNDGQIHLYGDVILGKGFRLTVSWASYQIHKLRVAHASEMRGKFSPPPLVCDPDMHHGTRVTHVPWCKPGSLTNGFLTSQWRGKRSRHSRRTRFYASCKRPTVRAKSLKGRINRTAP